MSLSVPVIHTKNVGQNPPLSRFWQTHPQTSSAHATRRRPLFVFEWNRIVEAERPSIQKNRTLTISRTRRSQGTLGYLNGFDEYQSNFILRHGWVEFPGYGADPFFLVHCSMPVNTCQSIPPIAFRHSSHLK